MKKLRPYTTIPCVTLALASADATAGEGTDSTRSTSLEFLYLHRNTDDVCLIHDGESSQPSLATGADELGWNAGVRVTYQQDYGGGQLQGVGLYIGHDADVTSSALGGEPSFCFDQAGGTFKDVIDTGFSAPDTVTFDHDTRLLSLETNYLHKTNNQISLLAGARLATLNGDLTVVGSNENGTGTLESKCCNTLIGAQIGAIGDIDISERTALCTNVKGGVFINSAERDFNCSTAGNPERLSSFTSITSSVHISSILEGNATICFEASDRVTFFVGGTAIYLINVAKAPKNLPQANTMAEFAKKPQMGSVLYAGAMGGLLVTF